MMDHTSLRNIAAILVLTTKLNRSLHRQSCFRLIFVLQSIQNIQNAPRALHTNLKICALVSQSYPGGRHPYVSRLDPTVTQSSGSELFLPFKILLGLGGRLGENSPPFFPQCILSQKRRYQQERLKTVAHSPEDLCYVVTINHLVCSFLSPSQP